MTEETIFQEALARSDADRARFLDQACSGQPQLRAAVEALLAAHEKPDNVLDKPPGNLDATLDSQPAAADSAATGEPTPNPVVALESRASQTATADFRRDAVAGVVIGGRYTLQEKIGEGGMGEVWVAKQTEPVKRKVALKLIKTGMDSRAVLQRFEQERQALALMNHPNIARVLDGGMTPTGQPFFVMELVNGLPLNKFCDEAKLTPKARLELFVPICQAVQHAHQKGIVHRDLKPANILVTMIDGKPTPKVIDFGVAKATGGKLTDEALSTEFGAVVGTLEYMSPEQAGYSGIDVDTRADIYSLGVILYELLTGLRPIDANRLRRAAYTEMIRIIQEEEPARPSTRLSTDDSLPSQAALRQTEPRRLMALLRGELDWIVMKCLEKQRDRRYETANGLARDIQRYLADEPVEARPPSVGYRLRKFLRRNRGSAIASSIIFVALVGGIVGTTWGMLRAAAQRDKANTAETLAGQRLVQVQAEQARTLEQKQLAEANQQRAEEERQVAEAVRDFLQKRLLGQADTMAQADALLHAGGLAADANRDITVRELLDRAAAELTPEKMEQSFPGQPLVQIEILNTIGLTYNGVGEPGQAVNFLKRAVDLCHEHLGAKDHDTQVTLHNLAVAYVTIGELTEALRLFEQVRDHIDPATDPERYWVVGNSLALTKCLTGNKVDALELASQVKTACEKSLGLEHPLTLQAMASLAFILNESAQFELAMDVLARLLPLQERALGATHPKTLTTLNNLAASYYDQGRYDKAIELGHKVVAARMVNPGPKHPDTLTSMNNLGSAYLDAGNPLEAIQWLERTRDGRDAILNLDHPHTLSTLHTLGRAYLRTERTNDAIATLERACAGLTKTAGALDRETLAARGNLANAYIKSEQLEKANTLLKEVHDTCRENLGPADPNTIRTGANLGRVCYKLGRFAEAIRLLAVAYPYIKSESVRRAIARDLLECYLNEEQWTEAADLVAEELQLLRQELPPGSVAFSSELLQLGVILLNAKRYADAEPLFRESHSISETHARGDRPSLRPWQLAVAKARLGASLLGQSKLAESRPYLVDGYELAIADEQDLPPTVRSLIPQLLAHLVQLNEATGDQDEAAKWRQELERRKTLAARPQTPCP